MADLGAFTYTRIIALPLLLFFRSFFPSFPFSFFFSFFFFKFCGGGRGFCSSFHLNITYGHVLQRLTRSASRIRDRSQLFLSAAFSQGIKHHTCPGEVAALYLKCVGHSVAVICAEDKESGCKYRYQS